MILVDTSAWVAYDRATGSPVDRRLTELIGTENIFWSADQAIVAAEALSCPYCQTEQQKRLIISSDPSVAHPAPSLD